MRLPHKLNPINKLLAGAMVLCLGQTASAFDVAPYFEAWGAGTLTGAKSAAGLDSATLAFAITRGTCAFDANITGRLADARSYVAAGGRLIVSLGGADGTYAEISCTTDDSLFNLIDKLIVDTGTRRLDFDVEGTQLSNTTGTARRARVLARLQAKYPDMYLSFTLPGWLNGLNTDAVNLLKTTVSAGVKIDVINIMSMDYGATNLRTMVVPPTMTQAVMNGVKASATQIESVYPAKSQAQIYAMMGITPMIGINDDGTVFTLADAQAIADFAKSNGIGFLSYWSFQRDVAQASSGIGPLNLYSGVAQSNYQFFNIFKSAGVYVPPAPAPAPAPAPTCVYPAWVQGKAYSAGSIVTYSDNKLYVAKFANPGYNPTISTYYWAPYLCTDLVAPAPAPTPVPGSIYACTFPSWIEGGYYSRGKIVLYSNGKLYIAIRSNPGYNPTISTRYWSLYNFPAWVNGKYYTAGSIVKYIDGNSYIAKFANPGYNPTISTYYWARYGC